MAAMSAAQLLDELMGRDRNLGPQEKGQDLDWADPQVCKHFLVRFCPHELFINTKADLGPCDKIHDERIRDSYKKSKNFECMGFEDEFIRFAQSMITDVERRIKRGRQRLLLTQQENAAPKALAKDNEEKIDLLTERINDMLEKVETLGCEGEVEEAQGIMKLCDQLKEEREALRRGGNPNQNEYNNVVEKQMEVCEVCGAFLIIGDAQQRLDDHLMGRQHCGYAMLRTTIDEVTSRQQEKKDERNKQRESEREERRKQTNVENVRDDKRRREDEDRNSRDSRDHHQRDDHRRQKSKSRSRDIRSRHNNYSRDKRRSPSRDRNRRNYDSSRDRNRYGSYHSKSRDYRKKSRSKSRDRHRRSRSKERRRSRSRDHRRSKSKELSHSRSKDKRKRSHSRDSHRRSKSKDRSRSRSRRSSSREARSRSHEHKSKSQSTDRMVKDSKLGNGDRSSSSEKEDSRATKSHEYMVAVFNLKSAHEFLNKAEQKRNYGLKVVRKMEMKKMRNAWTNLTIKPSESHSYRYVSILIHTFIPKTSLLHAIDLLQPLFLNSSCNSFI
ncbi:Luc7-like protein 3 [Nymphon striatum]|nr:Luc7-like protein 3 [Nymphon striatum]